MTFYKYIFFLVITGFYVSSNFGQSSQFEKVSKQYSLVFIGESSIKSTYENISNTGIGFEFDYAWKLSGYNKKK